jgi:hypothetical protein
MRGRKKSNGDNSILIEEIWKMRRRTEGIRLALPVENERGYICSNSRKLRHSDYN